MEPVWTITLFGGLRATQCGTGAVVNRFRTRKSAALLARLAFRLGDAPSTRDELIELLWPYADPQAALARLAVELSSLRRLLEPAGVPRGSIVRADRFTISLDPKFVTTDVAAFELSLRRARLAESGGERLALLTDAVRSYGGPLLPQIEGDWIEPERERLATLFVAAATDAVSAHLASGTIAVAIDVARLSVQRERMRERTHVLAMRAEIAAGQPADALRTLDNLRRMLQESGGDPPGVEARRVEAEARRLLEASGPSTLPKTGISREVEPADPAFPRPLPLGTLAILATDIEGSTMLGRSLGEDKFARLLERHHALMRAEFVLAGGIEFNEAGDGFCVAFEAAGDALRCACACQQALASGDDPLGTDDNEEAFPPIRVRMAIHVGDLRYTDAGSTSDNHDPPPGRNGIALRGTGSYRGLLLHELARIVAAANGGQILLTEAAEAVLRRNLPPGVTLVDRGRFRVRDAPSPERIFEAVWLTSKDVEDSPVPRAPFARTPVLPPAFTRFYGRESEIAAIADLLGDSGPSLVTVTGLGGAGKTRLAVEAARAICRRFGGAVWFVPLDAIEAPSRLGDAVRAVVAPDFDGELWTALGSVLADEPALLILDNVEHLLGSKHEAATADFLHRLLERFTHLRCLATSRQRIGISAEREIALHPLALPAAAAGTSSEHALDFAGIALFEDRAKNARLDFQVTDRNVAAVSALCARLDGIPLALELAAAWARLLTPYEMLEQFDSISRSRDRDLPDRHRSLDAAIEGSYRLLDDDQRAFFRGLSVLRGGWTLAAAKSVCDEPMALALLGDLRDRSLVVVEETGETSRYRFLETVRTFAAARLAENESENAERLRRLSDFYVALSVEANDALQGPDQAAWLARLAADHANLVAVLWSANRLKRLTMTGHLHRYFMIRGYLPEARQFLADVLTADNGDIPEVDLNKAINVAGVLALEAGDLDAARRFFEVVAERFWSAGDEKSAGAARVNLGIVAREQGDLNAAREAYLSTLDLFRRLNRQKALATVLSNLANVAREQRDLAAARSYLEESLLIQAHLDDKLLRANTLQNLASVADAIGDVPAAMWHARESFHARLDLGDNRGIARLLLIIASIHLTLGDLSNAAMLDGAAFGAASLTGTKFVPILIDESSSRMKMIEARIGPDEASRRWQDGRAMSWQEILAAAISVMESASSEKFADR